MDPDLHEQYEYARKRIRQKKHLYFHFVIFLLVSLFAFAANHFLEIGAPLEWYKWLIAVWLFFFILHFINVYITKRFMNKNWERDQIDKLVEKQQRRIQKLESNLENNPQNSF